MGSKSNGGSPARISSVPGEVRAIERSLRCGNKATPTTEEVHICKDAGGKSGKTRSPLDRIARKDSNFARKVKLRKETSKLKRGRLEEIG